MQTRYWLALVGIVALSVALVAAGASTPTEPAASPRVLVKVYSLADLVAPVHVKRGATTRSSMAEWSAGLQSDAEEQLERIQRVLRLAVPKESWDEDNGPGAIAVYPEKLSLFIRQTDAGHRAIDELLTELRKGDDFEIELLVEVGGFNETNDDEANNISQKFGNVLTAEDVVNLRRGDRFTSTIRVGNGRTIVGSGPLRYVMARFTAVAADRTSIELRLDNASGDAVDDQFSWATQTHSIPVNKTVGMLVACDGRESIFLITPRIVPRSQP